MSAVITHVDENSPAGLKNIKAGDRLIRINGHKIADVLDYKFQAYEPDLLLELHSEAGKIRLLRLRKPAGADLGLTFGDYLMDRPRACANKCVFCFVDQLPRGLRKTLYFKDDDVRLSFLCGNYVTLTNLSESEIHRIVALRVSPLNISVHSTDPGLRRLLFGTRRSDRALEAMRRFAEAGIRLNCQIVCCPGLNDGAELSRTMTDLRKLHPAVQSVSVVPVGLTKHREGLYPLRPFDRESALAAVRQVERTGDRCRAKLGTRLFYPADELYLKAGLEVPADAFYESYPQLENGVGMLRLLTVQADAALRASRDARTLPFSIATGAAARECLQKILNSVTEKYANIKGQLFAVRNDFFGETVDVAGLVTGGDLIRQLRGRPLGERLLITKNMLRHGEHVFLDDVTLADVSSELGVPVRVVGSDGADLIRAML
jgi:putative radical SAM enzyme (TIGR03279 family)